MMHKQMIGLSIHIDNPWDSKDFDLATPTTFPWNVGFGSQSNHQNECL